MNEQLSMYSAIALIQFQEGESLFLFTVTTAYRILAKNTKPIHRL